MIVLICLFFINTYSHAATTLITQSNGQLIVAPDPHVIYENGTYYMYPTAGDGNNGSGFGTGVGDIPIWTANNISGSWKKETKGVFGYDGREFSNKNLFINNAWYRSIWGPDIVKLGTNSFMLAFTATRHGHSIGNHELPSQREMGVYLAWSNSPKGPFAQQTSNHAHEPFPVGASSTCPRKNALPRSVPWASPNCQGGGECQNIVRLDINVFKDGGDYWMGYSWYTDDGYNGPLKGEHTSIVKLSRSDPFTVDCNATPIFIGNSRDRNLVNKLKLSCGNDSKCKEMLSFTKDKQGDEFAWGGVVEGPSIFKQGEYYYPLMSGSTWDSSYYHVYWIASKTIAGLKWDNPNRLVGRFLVPGTGRNSVRYAFGTGTVVRDRSGRWQYVYGGLIHNNCQQGDCSRYALVSPIEFVDKNDGKGRVHIKTIYPVEELGF